MKQATASRNYSHKHVEPRRKLIGSVEKGNAPAKFLCGKEALLNQELRPALLTFFLMSPG